MWTCDPKFSYRLLTGRRSKRGWSQSVRGNRFFHLISVQREVGVRLGHFTRPVGLRCMRWLLVFRRLLKSSGATGSRLASIASSKTRPSKLIDHLVERGIHPAVVIAGTFAVAALRDCVNGRWPIRIRKTKWEQATEDIGAFRKLAFDGPLAVAVEGRRRRATKPSGARAGQMALEPKETGVWSGTTPIPVPGVVPG